MSMVLNDNYASSRPGPAPPLDNDDLLEEILLRLSPKPSSHPRASLVCKRWRSILSAPRFLKRFRKHHSTPPMLGFFVGQNGTKNNFSRLLETKPDCIPAERFTLPKSSSCYKHLDLYGCRHGLAVLFNEWGSEAVVWDPLTGQQHRVRFPSIFCNASRQSLRPRNAAVLCTDAEDGHVHGDCFSSPFRLVLIFSNREYTKLFACLYESTSGVWGNVASMVVPTDLALSLSPSILIGNAVYFSFNGGDTLVFDIERQTLGVIEKPENTHIKDYWSFRLVRTNDASVLGFANLSNLNIRLWERKLNSDGVAKWVL